MFARMASDMLGIPPKVIMHKMNIDPKYKSVHQKKRSFMPKR